MSKREGTVRIETGGNFGLGDEVRTRNHVELLGTLDVGTDSNGPAEILSHEERSGEELTDVLFIEGGGDRVGKDVCHNIGDWGLGIRD